MERLDIWQDPKIKEGLDYIMDKARTSADAISLMAFSAISQGESETEAARLYKKRTSSDLLFCI